MAYESSRISQPTTSDPVMDDYLDAIKIRESLRGIDINTNTMLALLKHQSQLKRSVNTLSAALGNETAEPVRRALDAAVDTLKTLRSFVVDGLHWDPTITAPTGGSARAAQRAFDVPELAEAILSRFSAKDLLAASEVNRALAGTVSSSPSIQILLGLRPDHACQWWSKFEGGGGYSSRSQDRFPGFRCLVESDHRHTSDPSQPLDKAKVSAYCGLKSPS